jgi:type VI secretion system secreted protein VgrG
LASPDAKCEAISQTYRFELELISEKAELDLQSLLHQRAFLAFTPDGLGIHGLIYQIAQAESGKRLTRYKLSIVPQLSYLALRTNQRIFQHLTVPQIVAQVLQEHGIVEGGYQFLLGPTLYPKRD